MSDVDSSCTTIDDSDSEGSLVDFIVKEEEENSEDEDEDENENENENSDVNDEEEEKKDAADDNLVCGQYSAAMELEGLVVTETGLRRSARVSKGVAPVRYVDNDYIGLMLEDADTDISNQSSEEEDEEDDEE